MTSARLERRHGVEAERANSDCLRTRDMSLTKASGTELELDIADKTQ